MSTIQAIALADQFKTALDLVSRSNAIKIIKTVQEYESAREDYKVLIQYEKELDDQYNSLECVIQAKQAQAQKKDLAAQFDTAKKYLKNTPMLNYERAEESKRLAEEIRLQAEAKKLSDAETARQIAEKKKEYERLEKIAKAAHKRGDKEAAQATANLAAQTKADAQAIIQDAAQAVAPVVVVERTAPSVSRRMVPKWRYADAAKVPCVYHKNDEVKISGVVRSLRANHGIEGIEYYEEPA